MAAVAGADVAAEVAEREVALGDIDLLIAVLGVAGVIVEQAIVPAVVVRLEGGRWLSERKIFAAGSDTVSFEKVPSADMPVHVHLLAESGIHIIEVLNLEDLSRDGVREFLFVGAPLKLRGATGAPVRPLAFPDYS